MTSERLGEMFKGDSADMYVEKFPIVSMGGRADALSVRRRGTRNSRVLFYMFCACVFWCGQFGEVMI